MKARLRLAVALLLIPSPGALAMDAPGVASTTINPEYPLHLRILDANRSDTRTGVRGFGRGDLIGTDIRGFDYTFDCSVGFLHNQHADEFYQGRWKKQDLKIEILVQKVGSSHIDKCEINVAMKPAPYGKYKTSAAPPATAPATTPPAP